MLRRTSISTLGGGSASSGSPVKTESRKLCLYSDVFRATATMALGMSGDEVDYSGSDRQLANLMRRAGIYTGGRFYI